jgi:hypothetical protein
MKARKRIERYRRYGSTAQQSKAAFDAVAKSEAALLALGNRLLEERKGKVKRGK